MTAYPSQYPVQPPVPGLRPPTPGTAKAAKVLLVLACIVDDGALLVALLVGLAATLVAGAAGTLTDGSDVMAAGVLVGLVSVGAALLVPWLLVIIGFFSGHSWSRVFGAVFYGLRTILLVVVIVQSEELRWLLVGITALGGVTIFFMFHPATGVWLRETRARRAARRAAALTPHLPGPPQPW